MIDLDRFKEIDDSRPDEFIPIAQQTSLIKPLTLYVIDEALRQCRAWLEGGLPLAIAVNLSARNLVDADFPTQVAGLLERWQIVMNMDANEDDATIVRSTIDLGRNLGLDVVANGVENERVWDRLRALGCTAAQGYYLSRPVPPLELQAWLLERQDAACK